MTYRVTLNDKIYEVGVEQGEAIMISVSDAPAAPVPAAVPAVVPATPAVPVAAPVAQPVLPASPDGGELITSPLPGTVIDLKVTAGQSVKRGQILLLIEAMKMENEVLAPRDGVVSQIIASKGASVKAGAPLLTLA